MSKMSPVEELHKERIQDYNEVPPPLVVRWFHAIDSPIVDPIAIRKAKREKTLTNLSAHSPLTSSSASSLSSNTSPNTSPSTVTGSTSPPTPTRPSPKNWVPFSKRDNIALEKAFKGDNAASAVVPVNEDYLFEVNIKKREISPVYWEGPVYEVRRATWFIQRDGSKWLPCEENMSRQIEQGYMKHKPYVRPVKVETPIEEVDSSEIQKDEKTGKEQKEKDIGESEATTTPPPLSTTTTVAITTSIKKVPAAVEEFVEEKEYLLGPYLGQYVVYTSPTQAWLLDDTPSAKIAKSFLTKLTNNQNLGGTKLIRGYQEVERETKKKKEADAKKTAAAAGTTDEKKKEEEEKDKKVLPTTNVEESKAPRVSLDTGDLSGKDRDISPQKKKELDDIEMTKQQAEDYDNEESEEEVRNIDQIIFVIHGIGQQMSERMGQNFVHDVNVLRKTMKSTWPIAVSGTEPINRPNGMQVLPILWRKSILFGTDNKDEESGYESDLGSAPDGDDGCPTIDEITLDGAPNIRTLVADVFLDIPLYLTSKYHTQMLNVVTKEVNRVYKLFIERNPYFLKNNGQVSILAHSLGSLLAFDILTAQPFTPEQMANVSSETVVTDKKIASLNFPVKNYFALGSPLGMIMILRGHKMISRKALAPSKNSNNSHINSSSSNSNTNYNDTTAPVSFVYPAADNMYNIFHKSDPVAYRLEPLIVRHYGSKLKPTPIPYIKGGLKSVLDHGFNVTNDLANRAGAMFESFKSGLTSSLIMRGLGFSKPLEEAYPGAELQWRSQSEPELMASRVAAKGAAKIKAFNPSGRVDFYLQEGLLENSYISALSVHMSYWEDVDVAGFLIREVYKNQQLEEEEKKNNTVKTVLV